MNRIWRTLRLQARLDMATGVVVAAALLVIWSGADGPMTTGRETKTT